MLVKDQLRIRMEQLGMPINELAKRLAVSNQTVRHWLNGRSFPGKSKTPELERALSFRLDYSEGAAAHADTVEGTLQKTDVETFLAINALPAEVKLMFGRLAKAYAKAALPAPVAYNDAGMMGRNDLVVERDRVGVERSVARTPAKARRSR